MNTRRPCWGLLLLMLAASWLARQLPEWYRLWRARTPTTATSRRPSKTRWPWSLPPAPRARPARRKPATEKGKRKAKREA